MTRYQQKAQAVVDAYSKRYGFEELHGDSSPVNGRYQTWFWKFPDDVQGANQLLEVLLDRRGTIKARIDTLTTDELARIMYLTRTSKGSTIPGRRPARSFCPVGSPRASSRTSPTTRRHSDEPPPRSRRASARGSRAIRSRWSIRTIQTSRRSRASRSLSRSSVTTRARSTARTGRARAAVQKFQSEHQPDAGPVDGAVGTMTRATITAALAKVPPLS